MYLVLVMKIKEDEYDGTWSGVFTGGEAMDTRGRGIFSYNEKIP